MAARRDRIVALDGLRGIAALVVVMHHVFLVEPSLAGAYNGSGDPPGVVARLLITTPLHVLWAGPEAVSLFFVLSGYVLVRPHVRSGQHLTVAPYYAKRLVRLYLPVWGAVAIAYAIHASLGKANGAASWWLASRNLPPLRGELLSELVLIGRNPSGNVIAVLWSLRWEVYFSLLLPLVVLAIPVIRKAPLLFVAASLVIIGAASNSNAGDALVFLPMFLVGSGLASLEPSIGGRLRALPGGVVAAGAVLCVLGMSARWTVLLHERWAPVAVVVAAAALVLLAESDSAARVLASRPLRYVGQRSFSLYLVHEPIVVALAVTLGVRSISAWFVGLAAVLVSTATVLFFRLVEVPSLAVADRARTSMAALHGPRRRRAPSR